MTATLLAGRTLSVEDLESSGSIDPSELDVQALFESIEWESELAHGMPAATGGDCGTATNATCATSVVPSSCGNTYMSLAMCVPCT